MTTVPITLHVDAEAAKVYASVPAEDRKKIDVLLGLRLKELLVPTKMTLHEVMDQLGREAHEHGLTPEILESILQGLEVRAERGLPLTVESQQVEVTV